VNEFPVRAVMIGASSQPSNIQPFGTHPMPDTHGFLKQVLDGWELAPIITARTGNSFTTFDCSANIGDTVCARYFVPSGGRFL